MLSFNEAKERYYILRERKKDIIYQEITRKILSIKEVLHILKVSS